MPQLMLSQTHSWSTVTVVLVLTVRHQARHLTNQIRALGHVTRSPPIPAHLSSALSTRVSMQQSQPGTNPGMLPRTGRSQQPPPPPHATSSSH